MLSLLFQSLPQHPFVWTTVLGNESRIRNVGLASCCRVFLDFPLFIGPHALFLLFSSWHHLTKKPKCWKELWKGAVTLKCFTYSWLFCCFPLRSQPRSFSGKRSENYCEPVYLPALSWKSILIRGREVLPRKKNKGDGKWTSTVLPCRPSGTAASCHEACQ